MEGANAPPKKSKRAKSTSDPPQPSTSSVIAAVKRSSTYIENVLKEMETNQISPEAPILPVAPGKRLRTDSIPVLKPKLEPTLIRRAYTVLYRKKCTRKYRKCEGDGILEVVGRCGLVKDEEGTRIGQTCSIKPELIEPGVILSVGQVDVQIKDVIPTGSEKVISVKPINTKEPLGPKRSSPSQPPRYPQLVANLLVMPKPTKEHELVFNIKKDRVNDVTVTYCLAKELKPHQRLGVVFMYRCVMGITNISHFGAILADEIGMGKILQCVTLIWTLLTQGPYGRTPVIKRVLIVTPTNLIVVWEKEFYRWLGRGRIKIFVASPRKQSEFSTASQPVYIITYEMFVRHFDEVSKVPFDLIICDEGLRFRTATNPAVTWLGKLPCKRRLILTSIQIQNTLQEFFALADFVNPGCLGTNERYTDYFVQPILASREPTANEQAKVLGIARSTELNKITTEFILRRPYGALGAYLPTKTETVVFCKSSPLQQDLYAAVVKAWNKSNFENKTLDHFTIITILKKICNHPSLIVCELRGARNKFPGSLHSCLSTNTVMKLEESGKVKVLLNLLNRVAECEEKIVIVSSYIQTLGMLANLCEVKDYKYIRLDETVPWSKRLDIVTSFNNPWGKTFIFLLSAQACGLELNISGASRLVLFDTDWNPTNDIQEMSKIWRDGQICSVYLYRFLTTGTLEEKIYQRQITKTKLSDTKVDPANTSAIQFSKEELNEVFNYEFNEDCSTHTLLKCKCKCVGSVPDKDVEETETKGGPQLDRTSSTESSLGLNELMKWEHHKPPYEGKNIDTLLLYDSYDDISFMFRDHK